jgi:hypothetical protein
MKRTLMVLTLLTVALVTYSQTAMPRTNTRQHAQRTRIADGRQDGELNNREASALRGEQRHIRRTERRAKADGNVTLRERAMLERKQDRASRHIRKAKSN